MKRKSLWSPQFVKILWWFVFAASVAPDGLESINLKPAAQDLRPLEWSNCDVWAMKPQAKPPESCDMEVDFSAQIWTSDASWRPRGFPVSHGQIHAKLVAMAPVALSWWMCCSTASFDVAQNHRGNWRVKYGLVWFSSKNDQKLYDSLTPLWELYVYVISGKLINSKL